MVPFPKKLFYISPMNRRLLIFILFFAAFAYVIFSQPQGAFKNSEMEAQRLVFWGIYDLPEIYQPVIDEFQKVYPDIEITYRQFPNAEEYHHVLSKQLKRGKGPDIFLYPDQFRDHYFPYVNPTNANAGEGFAPLVEQHLVENRLLYGLPLWIDSLMLYFNKRYYKDGVSHKWYDFAEKTRELSIGGIAMGRFDNLKAGWDILKALFLQKQVVLSGKPENAVFDTLEFFTRFAYPIDRYFNWSEKLNRNYPDQEVDSFAREKVAAIAGYSPLLDLLNLKSQQLKEKGLRRVKRENIGVALFPQLSLENPRYLSKYFALGVSLHSKLPNQAWDFIRLLTNETNAEYYLEATGRIPGRLLAISENDSEMKRVQKEQAAHSFVYPVSAEVKEKISRVQERGVGNISLLREILEEDL